MRYYERVRELREANSLTQEKVAGLLFIGQRTYCDYESGKTRIPVDSLIRLAKYYDVSMDYICGLSNSRGSYPSAEDQQDQPQDMAGRSSRKRAPQA